jgi:hypothetical protein
MLEWQRLIIQLFRYKRFQRQQAQVTKQIPGPEMSPVSADRVYLGFQSSLDPTAKKSQLIRNIITR